MELFNNKRPRLESPLKNISALLWEGETGSSELRTVLLKSF